MCIRDRVLLTYGKVGLREKMFLYCVNAQEIHDVDFLDELVGDFSQCLTVSAHWGSSCHHCRHRCRTRVPLSRSLVKLRRWYGWRVRTGPHTFDSECRSFVIMYCVDSTHYLEGVDGWKWGTVSAEVRTAQQQSLTSRTLQLRRRCFRGWASG